MEKGWERNLKKIVEKENDKERGQMDENIEKTTLNDNNRQTVLSEQVRYENADDVYK